MLMMAIFGIDNECRRFFFRLNAASDRAQNKFIGKHHLLRFEYRRTLRTGYMLGKCADLFQFIF